MALKPDYHASHGYETVILGFTLICNGKSFSSLSKRRMSQWYSFLW